MVGIDKPYEGPHRGSITGVNAPIWNHLDFGSMPIRTAMDILRGAGTILTVQRGATNATAVHKYELTRI